MEAETHVDAALSSFKQPLQQGDAGQSKPATPSSGTTKPPPALDSKLNGDEKNGQSTSISISKTQSPTPGNGPWQNDYDIVHIIFSRFMQHQPNLLELGKARLELLKTFCQPTIAKQTNQQFLWIIRTDPKLHPTLKEGLIQALDGQPNVAVIGSNEVRKGSVDRGFRGTVAISDITPKTIFYGDLNLVHSFHNATKDRTLLETNLDADDGLALTFAESAQKLTKTKFENIEKKNGWMNLCVGRHLEWQYYAPWDKNTNKGSLRLGSTHVCVTPGFSWATQPKARPHFTEQHHLVKRDTPQCTESKKKFLGCWEEIPVPNPETDSMAIRARTPTSTGMNRVVMAESGWKKEEAATDQASWPLLEPSFAIPKLKVQDSHKYLSDHLQELVEENLKGQCTEDHSCSEGIKKKLKSLFFTRGKWQNKHNLVHAIHTVLEPSAFEILKYFLFETLESQTSYEFLWIIYAKTFVDWEMTRKLSKLLEKSPLNILVVNGNKSSKLDIRNFKAAGGLSPNQILHGNVSLLEDFHRAAQNRTLLDTSLDAREGVVKTFVAEIQNATALARRGGAENHNLWYVRCVAEFIEWRYASPQGDETEYGFLKIAGHQSGNCIQNPGSTTISMPGATMPTEDGTSETEDCMPEAMKDGCFVSMGADRRLSIRAVYPDSGSLEMSRDDLGKAEGQQADLRGELRDAFNIPRPNLRKLRQTLPPASNPRVSDINHRDLEVTAKLV